MKKKYVLIIIIVLILLGLYSWYFSGKSNTSKQKGKLSQVSSQKKFVNKSDKTSEERNKIFSGNCIKPDFRLDNDTYLDGAKEYLDIFNTQKSLINKYKGTAESQLFKDNIDGRLSYIDVLISDYEKTLNDGKIINPLTGEPQKNQKLAYEENIKAIIIYINETCDLFK